MKALLTSTAAAVVLAVPAYADNHMASEEAFTATYQDGQYRGTDLIGATLWQTESDIDPQAEDIDPEAMEWNRVGEINDIIVNQNGEIDHIVAAVGGFLGMGQDEISIRMDSLKFISDGEEADEWFAVLTTTPAALESAPNYEQGDARTSNAQMQENEDTDTAEASDDSQMKQEGGDQQMLASDAIQKEMLSTEDLTGAVVFTSQDENVGEVSELLLGEDGKTIERAVIDVGGFLGMGEKPVALGLDMLNVMVGEDGGITRVTVDATREELDQMPTWEDG